MFKRESLESELKKYNVYLRRLDNIDIEIELIAEMLGEGVAGIDYSSDAAANTNAISDTVANIVAAKEEKTKRLRQERKEISTKLKMIDNCLLALTERERDMIVKFYMEDISWQQIAEEYNMSYGWARKERDRAIDKMKMVYNG